MIRRAECAFFEGVKIELGEGARDLFRAMGLLDWKGRERAIAAAQPQPQPQLIYRRA